MSFKKLHQIYDPLYGHIELTPVEYKIIDHPCYQRLRWIKQLGFSFYVFPGAEHTRFLHSIGVMHTATKLMMSLGMITSVSDLITRKVKYAKLAQHIRLSALLHDVGQFPFSHTVEQGYLWHAEGKEAKHEDNHEHLGSYIIKNSSLSKILKEYDCDPQLISKIIKGDSQYKIANQILHSDVDADRLDYLLRDSTYTGIKYGNIDRDYIIYHARLIKDKNSGDLMAFNEAAQHALEGMLHSRFHWYSQVLKSNQGVKFDLIAGVLAQYFIEKKLLPSFNTLLDWAIETPDTFFQFNDSYFFKIANEQYKKKHPPMYRDLIEMLIYRRSPLSIRNSLIQPQVCSTDTEYQTKLARFEQLIDYYKNLISKNENAWLIYDKDSMINYCSKEKDQQVHLINRDDVVSMLPSHPGSVVSSSHVLKKFVPNIYCNREAMKILEPSKM